MDRITLEVIGSALLSVAEEMGTALIKASYSSNIKERWDCSTAVFDRDGQVIAQAEHIPMHLGPLLGIVQEILRRYPLDRLLPGDVFAANDPYSGGGTHLPDITLASPVFVDGELFGFVANIAHHADRTGERIRTIYDEGLRITPIRLVEGGQIREDVMELLLANFALPDQRQGDFRAQIAANRLGERRLQELCQQYGRAAVKAASDKYLAYGERKIRVAIAQLPAGLYRCPLSMAAREKAEAPKTYVQEVASDEPGIRVFVVKSDERLAYERTERLKAMERVRADLEALQRRVEQSRLKAADKIGAAAARILGRHHGSRYYEWEYRAGRFRFFEHPVNLRREEAVEGTYVIQTTEAHLTPVQAVVLYKGLSEVERAFANLKDVIEMRPIYHQTDRRVAAHIFVAALAFLLHRAVEKKLKAAGLDLSATEALQALRTVRVVDFTLGAGQTKRSVTRGTARAARILAALGITNLDPPRPSKTKRTAVW